MNNNYEILVHKWNSILDKVSAFGGKVRPLIIEPPATEKEISEKERSLGVSFPQHFKDVLLSFSKHVEFNWYFPSSINLPQEFREIFSGEIRWDLNSLENLNALAEELESRYEGEETSLRNKIQFMMAGNGDILAFDMGKGKGSIIYWDHETAEIYSLADNFIEYIKNITNLYGVGTEIWQYEMFLDEHGLNPNCTAAVKWRHWFDTFTMLSNDRERNNNLDNLIKYILYSGEIKQTELKALKKFDVNFVFNKVQECIREVDESQKEILYKIIGEVVEEHASDWVRGLWDNPMDINLKYRSYLTAKCLPTAEGLERVTYYVESQFSNSVKDYIAKEHLCHFRNYKVIDWMKGYISKGTTKDNWYSLFACSEPTWKQVKEWLENGGKLRMVAINALEYMVLSWNSTPSYIQGKYKITNPPSKDEAILVLEKAKSEEILNSKKKVYDMIIDHIDYLLF